MLHQIHLTTSGNHSHNLSFDRHGLDRRIYTTYIKEYRDDQETCSVKIKLHYISFSYKNKLSSQCNLTAQIEPVHDEKIYHIMFLIAL
jgi:hypothetical protein